MNYDHHETKYMIKRQKCINIDFHQNKPDHSTLNLLPLSSVKSCEISSSKHVGYWLMSSST